MSVKSVSGTSHSLLFTLYREDKVRVAQDYPSPKLLSGDLPMFVGLENVLGNSFPLIFILQDSPWTLFPVADATGEGRAVPCLACLFPISFLLPFLSV